MSNSVESPTPGEINGDQNTSVLTPAEEQRTTAPTVDPEANPAPVKIPPDPVAANGDNAPELSQEEKDELKGDGE